MSKLSYAVISMFEGVPGKEPVGPPAGLICVNVVPSGGKLQ